MFQEGLRKSPDSSQSDQPPAKRARYESGPTPTRTLVMSKALERASTTVPVVKTPQAMTKAATHLQPQQPPQHQPMDYEMMEQTRKRKREDEEQWQRRVVRKLEDERKVIQQAEDSKDRSNRDLYALFNDLQGMSAEYVSFFHILLAKC